MKQYKKKPVVIEAIQFVDDSDRLLEIQEFMGGGLLRVNYEDPENPFIRIETLEGEMKAMVGDYIIKGVNGEFYPCKPDIFKKTYDEEKETTFLDRLHIELKDLYSKMDKLVPFIDSGKIDEVVTNKYQNHLLRLQHRIMSRYINVLECRIGRLDGSPEAPLHRMTFGDAIEVLKQGGVIRRTDWNGKDLVVFKQVPAYIDHTIIPKMQSLPQEAKEIISDQVGYINYTSQCLIFNTKTGRADSWVPSISDVFSEDWEIVE